MFPFSRLVLATAAVLAGMIPFMTACNMDKPENIPAIREAIEGVKDLKSDARKTNGRLTDLETEVSGLADDMTNLRNAREGQGSAETAAAVKDLNKQVADLQNEIAQLKKQPMAAAKAAPEPATAPQPAAASGRQGAAVKKGKLAPPPIPAPAALEEVKPKGTYYTVKQGDTVDSIAQAKGVSTAALRAANHIPAGRNPGEGSSIFVPAP